MTTSLSALSSSTLGAAHAAAASALVQPDVCPSGTRTVQVQPVEVVYHQPWHVSTYLDANTIVNLGSDATVTVTNAPESVVTDLVARETCVTSITQNREKRSNDHGDLNYTYTTINGGDYPGPFPTHLTIDPSYGGTIATVIALHPETTSSPVPGTEPPPEESTLGDGPFTTHFSLAEQHKGKNLYHSNPPQWYSVSNTKGLYELDTIFMPWEGDCVRSITIPPLNPAGTATLVVQTPTATSQFNGKDAAAEAASVSSAPTICTATASAQEVVTLELHNNTMTVTVPTPFPELETTSSEDPQSISSSISLASLLNFLTQSIKPESTGSVGASEETVANATAEEGSNTGISTTTIASTTTSSTESLTSQSSTIQTSAVEAPTIKFPDIESVPIESSLADALIETTVPSIIESSVIESAIGSSTVGASTLKASSIETSVESSASETSSTKTESARAESVRAEGPSAETSIAESLVDDIRAKISQSVVTNTKTKVSLSTVIGSPKTVHKLADPETLEPKAKDSWSTITRSKKLVPTATETKPGKPILKILKSKSSKSKTSDSKIVVTKTKSVASASTTTALAKTVVKFADSKGSESQTQNSKSSSKDPEENGSRSEPTSSVGSVYLLNKDRTEATSSNDTIVTSTTEKPQISSKTGKHYPYSITIARDGKKHVVDGKWLATHSPTDATESAMHSFATAQFPDWQDLATQQTTLTKTVASINSEATEAPNTEAGIRHVFKKPKAKSTKSKTKTKTKSKDEVDENEDEYDESEADDIDGPDDSDEPDAINGADDDDEEEDETDHKSNRPVLSYKPKLPKESETGRKSNRPVLKYKPKLPELAEDDEPRESSEWTESNLPNLRYRPGKPKDDELKSATTKVKSANNKGPTSTSTPDEATPTIDQADKLANAKESNKWFRPLKYLVPGVGVITTPGNATNVENAPKVTDEAASLADAFNITFTQTVSSAGEERAVTMTVPLERTTVSGKPTMVPAGGMDAAALAAAHPEITGAINITKIMEDKMGDMTLPLDLHKMYPDIFPQSDVSTDSSSDVSASVTSNDNDKLGKEAARPKATALPTTNVASIDVNTTPTSISSANATDAAKSTSRNTAATAKLTSIELDVESTALSSTNSASTAGKAAFETDSSNVASATTSATSFKSTSAPVDEIIVVTSKSRASGIIDEAGSVVPTATLLTNTTALDLSMPTTSSVSINTTDTVESTSVTSSLPANISADDSKISSTLPALANVTDAAIPAGTVTSLPINATENDLDDDINIDLPINSTGNIGSAALTTSLPINTSLVGLNTKTTAMALLNATGDAESIVAATTGGFSATKVDETIPSSTSLSVNITSTDLDVDTAPTSLLDVTKDAEIIAPSSSSGLNSTGEDESDVPFVTASTVLSLSDEVTGITLPANFSGPISTVAPTSSISTNVTDADDAIILTSALPPNDNKTIDTDETNISATSDAVSLTSSDITAADGVADTDVPLTLSSTAVPSVTSVQDDEELTSPPLVMATDTPGSLVSTATATAPVNVTLSESLATFSTTLPTSKVADLEEVEVQTSDSPKGVTVTDIEAIETTPSAEITSSGTDDNLESTILEATSSFKATSANSFDDTIESIIPTSSVQLNTTLDNVASIQPTVTSALQLTNITESYGSQIAAPTSTAPEGVTLDDSLIVSTVTPLSDISGAEKPAAATSSFISNTTSDDSEDALTTFKTTSLLSNVTDVESSISATSAQFSPTGVTLDDSLVVSTATEEEPTVSLTTAPMQTVSDDILNDDPTVTSLINVTDTLISESTGGLPLSLTKTFDLTSTPTMFPVIANADTSVASDGLEATSTEIIPSDSTKAISADATDVEQTVSVSTVTLLPSSLTDIETIAPTSSAPVKDVKYQITPKLKTDENPEGGTKTPTKTLNLEAEEPSLPPPLPTSAQVSKSTASSSSNIELTSIVEVDTSLSQTSVLASISKTLDLSSETSATLTSTALVEEVVKTSSPSTSLVQTTVLEDVVSSVPMVSGTSAIVVSEEDATSASSSTDIAKPQLKLKQTLTSQSVATPLIDVIKTLSPSSSSIQATKGDAVVETTSATTSKSSATIVPAVDNTSVPGSKAAPAPQTGLEAIPTSKSLDASATSLSSVILVQESTTSPKPASDPAPTVATVPVVAAGSTTESTRASTSASSTSQVVSVDRLSASSSSASSAAPGLAISLSSDISSASNSTSLPFATSILNMVTQDLTKSVASASSLVASVSTAAPSAPTVTQMVASSQVSVPETKVSSAKTVSAPSVTMPAPKLGRDDDVEEDSHSSSTNVSGSHSTAYTYKTTVKTKKQSGTTFTFEGSMPSGAPRKAGNSDSNKDWVEDEDGDGFIPFENLRKANKDFFDSEPPETLNFKGTSFEPDDKHSDMIKNLPDFEDDDGFSNDKPLQKTKTAAKKKASSATQKKAPTATQKKAPAATQKKAPAATQKKAPAATQKKAPTATQKKAFKASSATKVIQPITEEDSFVTKTKTKTAFREDASKTKPKVSVQTEKPSSVKKTDSSTKAKHVKSKPKTSVRDYVPSSVGEEESEATLAYNENDVDFSKETGSNDEESRATTKTSGAAAYFTQEAESGRPFPSLPGMNLLPQLTNIKFGSRKTYTFDRKPAPATSTDTSPSSTQEPQSAPTDSKNSSSAKTKSDKKSSGKSESSVDDESVAKEKKEADYKDHPLYRVGKDESNKPSQPVGPKFRYSPGGRKQKKPVEQEEAYRPDSDEDVYLPPTGYQKPDSEGYTGPAYTPEVVETPIKYTRPDLPPTQYENESAAPYQDPAPRPPQEYSHPPPLQEYSRPPSQQEYSRPPSQQQYSHPPQQEYSRPPPQQEYSHRPPPPKEYFQSSSPEARPEPETQGNQYVPPTYSPQEAYRPKLMPQSVPEGESHFIPEPVEYAEINSFEPGPRQVPEGESHFIPEPNLDDVAEEVPEGESHFSSKPGPKLESPSPQYRTHEESAPGSKTPGKTTSKASNESKTKGQPKGKPKEKPKSYVSPKPQEEPATRPLSAPESDEESDQRGYMDILRNGVPRVKRPSYWSMPEEPAKFSEPIRKPSDMEDIDLFPEPESCVDVPSVKHTVCFTGESLPGDCAKLPYHAGRDLKPILEDCRRDLGEYAEGRAATCLERPIGRFTPGQDIEQCLLRALQGKCIDTLPDACADLDGKTGYALTTTAGACRVGLGPFLTEHATKCLHERSLARNSGAGIISCLEMALGLTPGATLSEGPRACDTFGDVKLPGY